MSISFINLNCSAKLRLKKKLFGLSLNRSQYSHGNEIFWSFRSKYNDRRPHNSIYFFQQIPNNTQCEEERCLETQKLPHCIYGMKFIISENLRWLSHLARSHKYKLYSSLAKSESLTQPNCLSRICYLANH